MSFNDVTIDFDQYDSTAISTGTEAAIPAFSGAFGTAPGVIALRKFPVRARSRFSVDKSSDLTQLQLELRRNNAYPVG